MMQDQVSRVGEDLITAAKLMESEWDDSREFAFRFFQESFDEDDFSPEILVAICDSVRADVQAFGRRLLMIHFQSEQAMDYLIKLSEHPAEGMQLFVSSFIERTIAEEPSRLQDLDFFYRCVLNKVNRGRICKQRIMSMLTAQALQDANQAAYVADLFSAISASISVEMRAACIKAMVQIRKAYPDVGTALQLKEMAHAL